MSLSLQIYTLITRTFVLLFRYIKLCLDFMVWMKGEEKFPYEKLEMSTTFRTKMVCFILSPEKVGLFFTDFQKLFHPRNIPQRSANWPVISSGRWSFLHLFGIYLQWSVIFYFLIFINPSLNYYWSFLFFHYDFIFKYAPYFLFYLQSKTKTENKESPFDYIHINLIHRSTFLLYGKHRLLFHRHLLPFYAYLLLFIR